LRIIIATSNEDKIKEFRTLLAPLEVNVVPMSETKASVIRIVEEGKTFEANAIKKAREVCTCTRETTIADDSGLEVDALEGLPGVFSARFAGENASYNDNNKKLLSLLEDVPWDRRTARFVCVIALVTPKGICRTVRGECEGYITYKYEGDKGFGYDPLFFYPPSAKTFGAMSEHEKNSVSHRGIALSKIQSIIREILGLKVM
jgi:XTP/dITP diphosphohydrolase